MFYMAHSASRGKAWY